MTTGSSNMTVRWIHQATGWLTKYLFGKPSVPFLCFYVHVWVYRMLFSCRTVIGWLWRTPSLNWQPLTTVWPSLSNTQIHGEPVSQSSSTSQTHDQLLANQIAVCSISVIYKVVTETMYSEVLGFIWWWFSHSQFTRFVECISCRPILLGLAAASEGSIFSRDPWFSSAQIIRPELHQRPWRRSIWAF